MIIREAITHGITFLKTAGIETPSLDASLLLAHILHINRSLLAAKGTEPLAEETFAEYLSFLERRIKGECVAYILGKKEFFNLDFKVNKNVLVPRPDTEILVETALTFLSKNNERKIKMLDICTGSGAIAIALKHEIPRLEVWAADISAQALETAKTNAKTILSHNSYINFCHGDLYGALNDINLSFSLIVSNPPYIPTDKIKTLSNEVQNEPLIALDGGKSGLEIIKRIVDKAPQYLEQGGSLLMEADPDQMENIAILLENSGFSNIKLYNDLSGQKRVIGGILA